MGDYMQGPVEPTEPTGSKRSCGNERTKTFGRWLDQPMVIAMVGLPARGKSYIVKMIIRHLKWRSYDCQIFNVGSHRRQVGSAGVQASFFNAGNPEGKRCREEMAMVL